jgi:hypothetical protein
MDRGSKDKTRRQKTRGGGRRQEVVGEDKRRWEKTRGGGRRQEEEGGDKRWWEETRGGGRRQEEEGGDKRWWEGALDITFEARHAPQHPLLGSPVCVVCVCVVLSVCGVGRGRVVREWVEREV